MNAPHESANQPAEEPKNTVRLVTFGFVAVLLIVGVGLGVNYAWKELRAPTSASAADCELAQQLLDKAGSMPSDVQRANDLEVEIRATRYARFEDDGISTEVGKYVHWKAVKATGQGEKPTRDDYDQMVRNAKGHCDDQRDLVIPGYEF
jgi:hypothetical protein